MIMRRIMGWLFRVQLPKANPQIDGDQRQAEQLLDSSLRRLKAAEMNACVQQNIVRLAARDLTKTANETVETLQSGERVIRAAQEAMELIRRQH